MYDKTLSYNGTSIAAYVHKRGPQITYTPVYGLPAKTTLDGVTHVDFVKMVRTITVPFNPSTPEEAKIIANLLNGGVGFLTFYNEDTELDETITVRPVQFTKDPALVKSGSVSAYQISNTPFQEL